ncbi:MAG: hypothetical protein PF481_06125 [Bacteroidales bacterium]|nr:hypothetical protein [Bacteroidales bacterium]
MKRFFLVLIVSITSITLYAQYSTSEVGITGFRGIDRDFQNTTLFGITFKPYITENIQLNYSLRMGSSEENGFTLQAPMGILGGGILFVGSFDEEEDGWAGLAILTTIIPEGITYNIHLDYNSTFSPYINILSMEFTQYYIQPYYEIGFSFKEYFAENIYASFDIRCKSIYTGFEPVGFVGGTIGICKL